MGPAARRLTQSSTGPLFVTWVSVLRGTSVLPCSVFFMLPNLSDRTGTPTSNIPVYSQLPEPSNLRTSFLI